MKKEFKEIKILTEEEKHKLLKEIVIARIKQMPDKYRLSLG